MKTGVQFCSKDGGAHVLTHEKIHNNTSVCGRQKDSVNFSNSESHSAIASVLQLDDEFAEKFIVQDASSGAEIHLQHHEELDANSMGLEVGETENHTLEWLKQNVSSSDVDMLEICSKDPAINLSMGMESHSDLSSENLDYMFAKQNSESNYFEALENGEYTTSMTNFSSSDNINWSGHNAHSPKIEIDTVCHLAAHSDVGGEYVSFSDQDVMGETMNSTSTSDLNSILFENLYKPDPSAVKMVQFTDNSSTFIDDSKHENSTFSNSAIKTVPLTFSRSHSGHLSVSDLNEVPTDLNLSSLPNFLGLENITNPSLNSDFIDSQTVVNILQGLSPSVNSPNNKNDGCQSEFSQDHSLQRNPGLNITTISISNDEENSTKILVDSHQGQQQMYVIKTTDLNQPNCSDVNLTSNKGQQLFVISTSDLNHSRNDQFVSTSEEVRAQMPSLDQNSDSLSQRTTFATGLPGYVLMPVVDSTSSLIKVLPVSLQEENSKRPAKKVLMCSEPGCRKTFKKASKLKVHQMLHTGERPFKCELLGCEWAFTTSNKLKRHMESHEGRKDFVCDKPGCGHRFTTIYNLNTHRKIHERPCTEPCPERGCDESFPTKRQLDLHLRNVHAFEDRTFKCPEPGCEKVFYSSGCMGSHMRVHQQKSEDLQCKYPGCGKEFKKVCRLKQHQKLHTGEKPYICNYQDCNWAFATASKLKRHQTKHTGLRKWSCPLCRKQFHRSEHLRGHLITHSGDRPFVCPVEDCGNTFTSKSSWYVHLKKHDESGKTIVYHCPMENCQRHYANKASLRQHILVKHCTVQQGTTESQGTANNWLNLLSPGDQHTDVNFSQETYNEALTQAALVPSQDSELATDFLTGGMADQALLHSTTESLPDQSSNNHISHLMISTSKSTSIATLVAGDLAVQPRHYSEDHQLEKRLMDTADLLQRERLSIEVVERGKKSQIMLENMHGSARTDPRSNEIISQRSLKRWQKQKEILAAKLKNNLEADNKPKSPVSIIQTATVDYKNPVSNNVSLGAQLSSRVELCRIDSIVSASDKEIPDMELQAEGIPDLVLDGGVVSSDSFMTDLFIRDPETGITYRQTQLLQDDPPNPEMMEDDVVPSHSMVLDTSLDVHFVEDSLNFNSLE
ncbi:hypothetical protein Btru_018329 [Bulinus truncatus]|nr:hypothetical protein Btru_018329 [Bulinus truncatus]